MPEGVTLKIVYQLPGQGMSFPVPKELPANLTAVQDILVTSVQFSILFVFL